MAIISIGGKKHHGKTTLAKVINYVMLVHRSRAIDINGDKTYPGIRSREDEVKFVKHNLPFDRYLEAVESPDFLMGVTSAFQVRSFADAPKWFVARTLNVPRAELDKEEFKKVIIPPGLFTGGPFEGVTMTVRDFLRETAEGLKGIFGQSIWANLATEGCEDMDVIFDDVRFPVEIDAIKRLGQTVLKVRVVNFNKEKQVLVDGYVCNIVESFQHGCLVTKPSGKDEIIMNEELELKDTDLHVSENSLAPTDFDITVYNNGSIGDLITQVEFLLQEAKILKINESARPL